ncbi:hypothetical protein ACNQF7_10130 [Flavobacterium sp. RSP29]|uniref:hypothetical protein n=1 Tax=Flavobacterium sp. RSP29 TaxID=3401731 RepID=UPI003AAD99C8
MAGQKFFALVANRFKEIAGIQVSTGAADAGKIPALGSTGTFDISLFPAGIGAEVVVAVTSENLAAGNFVNLYSNAGVITLRKTDATNNTKPAQGFVITNSTSPASNTMYILGVANDYLSGLAVGTEYVLSKSVPGGVTPIDSFTPAPGNIVQLIGKATAATSALTYANQNYVEVS